MTNPNVALYEELKDEFASKPTRYSMTDDIENLGATLSRLENSDVIELDRYHTFREMPTFLFSVRDAETWILIDVLDDSTKVVIRSNESMEAMTTAFSLVSGLTLNDATWQDLAELKDEDQSHTKGDSGPF